MSKFEHCMHGLMLYYSNMIVVPICYIMGSYSHGVIQSWGHTVFGQTLLQSLMWSSLQTWTQISKFSVDISNANAFMCISQCDISCHCKLPCKLSCNANSHVNFCVNFNVNFVQNLMWTFVQTLMWTLCKF